MSTTLSGNFEVNAALPLDEKTNKDSLEDRNSIPDFQRYRGMIVTVKENDTTYRLGAGLSNSDWNMLGNPGDGVYEVSKITFSSSSESVLDFGQQLVGSTGVQWIPLGGIAFKYGKTGAGGDRVKLMPSGNVGIGYSFPAYKLDVNGDFRCLLDANFGLNVFIDGYSSFYPSPEHNLDFGQQLVGSTGVQWIPSTGLMFKHGSTGPAGSRNGMLANGNLGLGTESPAEKLQVHGNISLAVAGNKIKIKEGSNSSMGIATLSSGFVTVNTTAVNDLSRIILIHQNHSGTIGNLYPTNIINGTSFDINSDNLSDNSDIFWLIIDSI